MDKPTDRTKTLNINFLGSDSNTALISHMYSVFQKVGKLYFYDNFAIATSLSHNYSFYIILNMLPQYLVPTLHIDRAPSTLHLSS